MPVSAPTLTIEDAVYPTAFMDTEGKPFGSDSRYLLHFNKDRIPPVRLFCIR